MPVEIPSTVECVLFAIVVVVCDVIVLIDALPIYNAVELAITLAPTDTANVLPVKIPVLKLVGSTLADDVLLAIVIKVELARALIELLPTKIFSCVIRVEWMLFANVDCACVCTELIDALPRYNDVALAMTLAPIDIAIVLPVKIPVLKLIGSTLADDVLLAMVISVEFASALIELLPTRIFSWVISVE